MLTRATASEHPILSTPKPTSIFKSIRLFLPFGPRKKPSPLPVSEKPLPSHLPIGFEIPFGAHQGQDNNASLLTNAGVPPLQTPSVNSGWKDDWNYEANGGEGSHHDALLHLV